MSDWVLTVTLLVRDILYAHLVCESDSKGCFRNLIPLKLCLAIISQMILASCKIKKQHKLVNIRFTELQNLIP